MYPGECTMCLYVGRCTPVSEHPGIFERMLRCSLLMASGQRLGRTWSFHIFSIWAMQHPLSACFPSFSSLDLKKKRSAFFSLSFFLTLPPSLPFCLPSFHFFEWTVKILAVIEEKKGKQNQYETKEGKIGLPLRLVHSQQFSASEQNNSVLRFFRRENGCYRYSTIK